MHGYQGESECIITDEEEERTDGVIQKGGSRPVMYCVTNNPKQWPETKTISSGGFSQLIQAKLDGPQLGLHVSALLIGQ